MNKAAQVTGEKPEGRSHWVGAHIVGSRLLRRTFFVALLLVSVTLISSTALELVFRYRESVQTIGLLQKETARGAAFKIQQFVLDIQKTMRAATHDPANLTRGFVEDFEFQLFKLLKFSPAIASTFAMDAKGKVLFRVSRLEIVSSANKPLSYAKETGFRVAIKGRTHFGDVYFVRQSEPHIKIWVPIEWFSGDRAGVLMAEVNLKYIWEVVSNIRVGKRGYAYVVSADGELIAFPDISQVLQRRNLSDLGQVQAAIRRQREAIPVQPNLAGEDVFAAYASVPELGWAVLVERPVSEAYVLLFNSILRSGLLLLVGLGAAGLASLLIRRRIIQPIQVLRRGAARIGKGELDHKIEIHTGDDLEWLADEFNEMAVQLRAEREGLEKKVEERTEELEVASKHKTQFLANMSHELRTPLNAILGYTELIRDGIYGPVEAKINDVMGRIQVSGRHLLGLINDVLDLSKIEAGQMQLSIAQYSLKDVVQNVFVAVEGLAAEKKLALRMDIADELPVGEGDEHRITQVLVNLAGNALKFTEQGSVTLSARAENGNFLVSVSDTGPGISAEDQRKIFDEFQQADGSSTKTKGGTGLGLAIARKFIEMHHGTIWVESTPGKGSTFSFTLPQTFQPQEGAK